MSSSTELIEFKLCNRNDMTENSMKEFELNLPVQDLKVKVLLIKQNNKFYCLGSKCSHYQVPLVNGVLYKDRVRCMAHGACFNIKTGDIEDYPGLDCIPKYDVFLDESNDVYIKTTIQELMTIKRVKEVNCTVSSFGLKRPSSSKLKSSSQVSQSKNKFIPKCLIIGSGAAGLLCLDTLREAGYSSNITMLTQEAYLPYDRPKLSKVLNSKINNIVLRDEEYFKSNNINFLTNQKVENIDFDKKEVYCDSGRIFDYDKLVIATGLKSIKLPPKPGDNLKGIFTLRSLDDANTIMKYFDEKNLSQDDKLNIVLVGGSFISMEIASFFADKANVTVVGFRKPFELMFGNFVSNKILNLHESKGVKFYINKKFDIIEYKECNKISGQLGSIKIHDGSEISVNILILAIGSQPATEFLINSPIKLTKNNYVYVDKCMKTNLDDVYAVGDITYFPNECLTGLEFSFKEDDDNYLNISHWGLASSQGKIAAKSIINQYSGENNQKNESLQVVPFFWTAQHGKNIRFAGYNKNYDIILFYKDKSSANVFKFAAFYLLLNKVVAVCTLDWDPVCALFAEALSNGIEVRKEDIEDDPLEIKNLLK